MTTVQRPQRSREIDSHRYAFLSQPKLYQQSYLTMTRYIDIDRRQSIQTPRHFIIKCNPYPSNQLHDEEHVPSPLVDPFVKTWATKPAWPSFSCTIHTRPRQGSSMAR